MKTRDCNFRALLEHGGGANVRSNSNNFLILKLSSLSLYNFDRNDQANNLQSKLYQVQLKILRNKKVIEYARICS